MSDFWTGVHWGMGFRLIRRAKRCPSCERRIPRDAEFCPYCGYELSEAESEIEYE